MSTSTNNPNDPKYQYDTFGKQCNWPDCCEPAVNEVVFQLRVHADHPAATTTPIARLCEKHSGENLWKAFYTPAGWKQICLAFEGGGYQRPSEKHSHIIAQPIGTASKTLPNLKPGTGFQQN